MDTINWIDVLIIIVLISSVGRGLRIGFFRQVFTIAGFFAGLFLGSFIMPTILDIFKAGSDWSILGVIVTLFLSGQAAAVGDMFGRRLRSKIHQRSAIEKVESILGIAVSIVSVLVVVWLLSAMFLRLPIAVLSEGLDGSAIVQRLNARLPSAPGVIERFGKIVHLGDFPKVFVDLEPRPSPVAQPSSAEVQMAGDKAKLSTVKIQGYGCGGLITGSGFVVGDGLVATNAHVVAGIRRPVVIDSNGRRQATVVLINPDLDFAVLRAPRLAGPALTLLTEDIPRGTSSAVVGYPAGGPYTISSAVILSRYDAVGRNIYDTKITSRNIYEIQSNVESGNSGGPLVLPNGKVAGGVFAKSVSSEGFGYALSAEAVAPEVAKAASQFKAVNPGRCAVE